MSVARERALTQLSFLFSINFHHRRNECCPWEGIDTRRPLSSWCSSACRNERCPWEGLSTSKFPKQTRYPGHRNKYSLEQKIAVPGDFFVWGHLSCMGSTPKMEECTITKGRKKNKDYIDARNGIKNAENAFRIKKEILVWEEKMRHQILRSYAAGPLQNGL